MSDNVFSLISLIITSVVVPIVLFLINQANAKRLREVVASVEVVDKKLDENHKQMNGHMTKLLETTAELATEKEKNKQEGKDSEKDKKK